IGHIEDVARVNTRDRASGITRDMSPIKRLDVSIHTALLPGYDEQGAGHYQVDSRLQPRLPSFQSRVQQNNPTNARCDNSQASQVLPVIGYKRIDKKINVQETQRR